MDAQTNSKTNSEKGQVGGQGEERERHYVLFSTAVYHCDWRWSDDGTVPHTGLADARPPYSTI